MAASFAITECSDPKVEFNASAGTDIYALTFSANGQYLVSGNREEVRVWRVDDGREVATMETGSVVECLAVSGDDRWIAAGTEDRGAIVWDAKTHEEIWQREWVELIGWENPSEVAVAVKAIDFSSDSSRLVVVHDCTATEFEVANWEDTFEFSHENALHTVKFSPDGDRIATATFDSVQIWDGNDGRSLVDIKEKVTPNYNPSLLWFDDHLFVLTGNKINRVDASTGSLVFQWEVPSEWACITLLQHGRPMIAYSTEHSISFWDTLTHTRLTLIQHAKDTRSVSFSTHNPLFAVVSVSGKIAIKRAPSYFSLFWHLLYPAFQEPAIPIVDPDAEAIDSWKRDDLVNADALLTAAITKSGDSKSLVLACRAIVRTRLRQWDTVIADAEKSIKIQPSVLGYIAKSIAYIGKGEKDKAYRACDIAFEHLHSTPISYLLLMKAIIVFLAGAYEDAISRLDDLIATNATVRDTATCHAVQAYMHVLVGKSRMESQDFDGAIQSFGHARARPRTVLGHPFTIISLIFGWKFEHLDEITLGKLHCEAIYAAGHMKDAAESLLNTVDNVGPEVYMNGPAGEWVSDFTQRCLFTSNDDSRADLDSDVDPTPLLKFWAKLTLTHQSWKDASTAGVNFAVSSFTVYRALCEHLERVDRVTEALECLVEAVTKVSMNDEQLKWTGAFRHVCAEKLARFGDAAMDTQQHDMAVIHYTATLSLHPLVPLTLLRKRSKAYAALGLWMDALKDANEVIALDPTSLSGYEHKYEALRGARRYNDMLDTFEIMLSMISQSPDSDIHARWDLCIKSKEAIRSIVPEAIRESPRVLINTRNGRLCNKSEQAAAIESSPVFTDLILSMTTHVDHERIEQGVKDFYRYATFSHRWEPNEPLYDRVVRIFVYELDESSTHNKLQMFCKIVEEAGFNWAWSDTCCIDKADHFVLQEALVAMFKWYEGSSLTVIFLRGVHSSSLRGALVKSDWNTRVWTFQEYHASKVVRFYTEDWKPYLNLDVPNHKESPEIISEMEEATGISAGALMALRPGLDDIRRKLCLASNRQTSLVEDAAYSLLGIFSISLPVVYGEGDKALGRLLAQLLASSGDTNILAWTGKSGSFNSCLPAYITVFREPPTTHIPTNASNMDTIISGLQASSLNLAVLMKFYDQLIDLPEPSFAGKRMKLPCITFKLGPLSGSRSKSGWVFRAQTTALGIVEIRTTENLSRLHSLCLVHPWIDFLLDRQPVGSILETVSEEFEHVDSMSSFGELLSSPGTSKVIPPIGPSRASWLAARLGLTFSTGDRTAETLSDIHSLRPPSSISHSDKQREALRVLARLKQPFGALLLAANPGNVSAFTRVSAESLITVRVAEDNTPALMNKLVESVRVLGVL